MRSMEVLLSLNFLSKFVFNKEWPNGNGIGLLFFVALQGGQHPQLEPLVSQQKNPGTYMNFLNKFLSDFDKN